MTRIKINQKESTIPQPAKEKILKAIREGLPGISNVIAIEIITERKARAEILASTEKVALGAERKSLDKPVVTDQPCGQSGKEHPCIDCKTLQAFLKDKGTKPFSESK